MFLIDLDGSLEVFEVLLMYKKKSVTLKMDREIGRSKMKRKTLSNKHNPIENPTYLDFIIGSLKIKKQIYLNYTVYLSKKIPR